MQKTILYKIDLLEDWKWYSSYKFSSDRILWITLNSQELDFEGPFNSRYSMIIW